MQPGGVMLRIFAGDGRLGFAGESFGDPLGHQLAGPAAQAAAELFELPVHLEGFG